MKSTLSTIAALPLVPAREICVALGHQEALPANMAAEAAFNEVAHKLGSEKRVPALDAWIIAAETAEELRRIYTRCRISECGTKDKALTKWVEVATTAEEVGPTYYLAAGELRRKAANKWIDLAQTPDELRGIIEYGGLEAGSPEKTKAIQKLSSLL